MGSLEEWTRVERLPLSLDLQLACFLVYVVPQVSTVSTFMRLSYFRHTPKLRRHP